MILVLSLLGTVALFALSALLLVLARLLTRAIFPYAMARCA